ncbi:MAG TPA: S9 family peptidase, partial [Sphingomicrobium sp.]|nr:S9 family peptidase [Sphingomicrobium sp.]
NPIFTGRDLFDLSVATDPQISPDGRTIAYVRRSNDIMTDRLTMAIWLIDTATGAERPLVTGRGAHYSPRWSPDGTRLAYVSNAEGSAQLFVRWVGSGESARITGMPESPSSLAWSPDGRQIAYVMAVPDEGPKLGSAPAKPEGADWARPLEIIDKITYRNDGRGYVKPGFDQLFIVSATGGAPRQMTWGAFHHGGPLDWTPDSRSVLLSANRSPQWERDPRNSEIFAVDAATGALSPLTRRNGPDFAPVVSPDGRHVAYLGYDDDPRAFRQAELYVMNRDGSAPRRLAASLDRPIQNLQWNGNSLIIQYEDDGGVALARVGLDGRVQPLTRALAGSGLDRPYVGGEFSVARNGTVALTTGSADRPSDVALWRGGQVRKLTDLNRHLAGKRLGAVRELAVRAPDGQRVPSWIVLPPNYQPGQRVPLILEIHGGPAAAYGPFFATDYQLYAAAGYAVLFTNPRGSTSYGQAFMDAIDKKYPGPDYPDLMAAVDAAIAEGIADPQNLFVTGGSGGGVLTAWVIGKTDRFRAAAAQKPVINMASQVLTADSIPYFGKYWFGKMPWEDPQGYWARSPLSLVGNVKTPTLVVVGSEDYRTPVSESEQYYSALQLRGVPTALVKVPGASHGFAARPSQSAARASAIIAWFDKYRVRTPGEPARAGSAGTD